MVCIGGKPINQGGCGSSVTKGCKIKEDGAKEQIEIKDNDMIIFKDTYPSANSNHQFDGGSVESWADTIYEMRGAGGGGVECTIRKIKCTLGSGYCYDVDVSCGAGEVVAGGGNSSGVKNDTDSYPLNSTTWRCIATLAKKYCYAICCKGTSY